MKLLVGYARVPREQQDLTSQRNGMHALGVGEDRIYVGHGLTDTNRDRPGLRLALAACRAGDTLVVTRLDRLARSLSDAEAVLVAARRHSRPVSPAARHAWTSSGDWSQAARHAWTSSGEWRQRADASAPVILKKAVSSSADLCGWVGWHWDPQCGYPTEVQPQCIGGAYQPEQHVLTMRAASDKAGVGAVDPKCGQFGGCTAAAASASRGRQLNGEHLRQWAGQGISVVSRHLLIHLSVTS
jgi:hypothetical protein